jgi:hypothetical protein
MRPGDRRESRNGFSASPGRQLISLSKAVECRIRFGIVIHFTAISRWLALTARSGLIAVTIAAPLIRTADTGNAGAHCRTHDSSAMAGMDHGGGAAAPQAPDGQAFSGHDCSHCPPSDCTTTATCAGLNLSAAVRSEPATWPTCSGSHLTIGNAARWFRSTGFPPPTPPPQA